MASWRKWTALVALIVVQTAGFAFFVTGFFPSKVVLQGSGANHFDHPNPRQFDKLILMVVDAMRSDFAFSEESHMSFVHSLIRDKKALGFTAFSNPPTVTLPRLKGITTGSTPNFLDAILNIAEDDTSSTLGDADSWIKQLYSQDRKIHMYGDDTWIKLFPTYFSQYEGTNSFYVADFTEVDNNVTRHIDDELANDNWDCLILHYLGLDHIGHKGGPQSPHMPAKQREMDSIIERIYNDYVDKNDNTLFVVLGDHGMNEVGNHGGSSTGETSAALLAISNKFQKIVQQDTAVAPLPSNDEYSYYTAIQQIDLVPTLATLLGFPIPKNNLGMFIDQFKNLYSSKAYVNVLLENAYQLKELIEHSFGANFVSPPFDSTEFGKFSKLWFQLESEKSEDAIKAFIIESQSKLAESATNYNYQKIYTGFTLFAASAFVFVFWFLKVSHDSRNFVAGCLTVLFSFLLSLSTFGSSLIEEEYQIWWWFITIYITALMFYLKPPYFSLNFGALVAALRIIRGWNNSGQKFNSQANLKIGKILDQSSWSVNLIVGFYFFYLFMLFRGSGLFRFSPKLQPLVFFLIFTLMAMSLIAKLITYYLQDEMRNEAQFNPFVLELFTWTNELFGETDLKKCLNPIFIAFYYLLFAVLAIRLLISAIGFKTQINRATFFGDIANLFTILLLNQTASKNLLMFGIFLVLRYIFGRLIAKSTQGDKTVNIFKVCLIVTTFNILVQNFTFFSLGNTNSLSTVDLTNAFNGLSEYDLVLCGLLTFSSNWAGPIFWSLSSSILMLEKFPPLRAHKFSVVWYKMLITMAFYSIIGVGLLSACISLRFHLFIWTVFSPKLLYFGSWYVLMNLGVDFIISLMLVALY